MEFIRISNYIECIRVYGVFKSRFPGTFPGNGVSCYFPSYLFFQFSHLFLKICRGKNRDIRTWPATDFTGVTCLLCLYWKLVKITYFCIYLCTQNRRDFVSRGTLWIWKQQCKHNVKLIHLIVIYRVTL